jgi:hypothetical protein
MNNEGGEFMSETDAEYAAFYKDAEADMENEQKAYAEIAKLASAWAAKWPNHCKACGGWGGSSYPATGPSYSCGGEPGGFDLCEALPDGACHRCGAITSDLDGACRACGWNFDDGVPQL